MGRAQTIRVRQAYHSACTTRHLCCLSGDDHDRSNSASPPPCLLTGWSCRLKRSQLLMPQRSIWRLTTREYSIMSTFCCTRLHMVCNCVFVCVCVCVHVCVNVHVSVHVCAFLSDCACACSVDIEILASWVGFCQGNSWAPASERKSQANGLHMPVCTRSLTPQKEHARGLAERVLRGQPDNSQVRRGERACGGVSCHCHPVSYG